MNCSLCDRVKLTEEKKYPYLIHEFAHSFLMLGEHQFYKGYCVLVAKGHFKEMTDMPEKMQAEMFQEMMTVSKTLEGHFQPSKMNLCSLGNVVPHVHWHFFPRYSDDAQFTDPPWLRMQQFESAKVTPEEARELIEILKLLF
jgi:diadenosine tetraphosphate (Ap4A) HIT family hydrolase